MNTCIKCNKTDISIDFKHLDQKIYWSEHKEITNIRHFTRDDRYYTSDNIIEECLVYSCKTCGYRVAEKTKDSN